MTPEEIEARRNLITGSRIARIAGLSKFGGPLSVYREMVEGHSIEETEPMQRGRVFEPGILRLFGEKTGADLTFPGLVTHPRLKFLGATPDAIARVDGELGPVEAKNVNWRLAHDWGEDGTDQVPVYYLPQIQLEMAVVSARVAWVPVVIGGDDYRCFRVGFDAELFEGLAALADKFMRDHIIPQRPPAVDASEDAAHWLASRFPRVQRPELAEATPEVEALVAEYRAALAVADGAKARRDLAKNRLKEAIADGAGFKGSNWTLRWSDVKGREATDWQAVVKEAGVPAEVVKKHTTRKAGYRALKPSWKEDTE